MALRITFLKTGTNPFGAITGQLNLWDDSSQVIQAQSLSAAYPLEIH